MANTPKKGLDYFPLEVGYFIDPKTELINAEFGIDGEYLFLRLLSIIYSDKGYYYEWNEDKALILAKKCGFSLDKIELILVRLVERSMFDKQLFHSAKVLTSRKIQKVYIRACAERKSINIYEEFFLLNDQDKKELPLTSLNKLTLFSKNQPINKINPTVNKIDSTINYQSKVKYSKEKESKEELSCPAKPSRVRKQKKFVPPTLQEVIDYCKERNNSVDAKRFFDYFDASGWIDSEGKPVLNWKQKVITWENNSRERSANNAGNGKSPRNNENDDIYKDITGVSL